MRLRISFFFSTRGLRPGLNPPLLINGVLIRKPEIVSKPELQQT
jgi:hypothetical protein